MQTSYFSLAQEMTKKARELNITYHPILDNFHEFDDVPRTEFNQSLKFHLSPMIFTGAISFSWFPHYPFWIWKFLAYKICKKPCVTVVYRMTLDKFSMTPEEISSLAGGPNRGLCLIQLSRTVQFKVVKVKTSNNLQLNFLSLLRKIILSRVWTSSLG